MWSEVMAKGLKCPMRWRKQTPCAATQVLDEGFPDKAALDAASRHRASVVKAEQRRQIKNALMWLRESVRQPLDLNVNRSAVLQCTQHNDCCDVSAVLSALFPCQMHVNADVMRGCHLHVTQLAESQSQLEIQYLAIWPDLCCVCSESKSWSACIGCGRSCLPRFSTKTQPFASIKSTHDF